jgi:hypothetical protein
MSKNRKVKSGASAKGKRATASEDMSIVQHHAVQPQSSMMSIRSLGSPTCSPVCRITPPTASANFCLGIGFGRTPRQRLLEPHNS